MLASQYFNGVKEGMAFQTGREASTIYRLFLHVAPGDICSGQAVCFLWRCCLRNSTEIVLIRVSTDTVLKVTLGSHTYSFLQKILRFD